jgi:hypothetical protein
MFFGLLTIVPGEDERESNYGAFNQFMLEITFFVPTCSKLSMAVVW